jgi:peptidylamidoglycolate lyase
MKRKQFLQQTSLAATGMLLAPSLLSSEKTNETILGHNNKRYRINTKWSKADVMQYPVKAVLFYLPMKQKTMS